MSGSSTFLKVVIHPSLNGSRNVFTQIRFFFRARMVVRTFHSLLFISIIHHPANTAAAATRLATLTMHVQP